ncbi:protein FAM151B [Malaya genurostris]|uniref:protein FAM151B n=1 Tax=Malaya genurostris TaxID=325434 RepID=UPI0026F39B9B|nr:protein FAM151B [Malaya genurostris]
MLFVYIFSALLLKIIESMDIPSLHEDYTQKPNLTSITWAHAVNNKTYLSDVLNNANVNFIEADISMGYLEDDKINQNLIPVMAHPPAIKSDLSLNNFLKQIRDFNMHANTSQVKGVKLDFKSIEALEQSVGILSSCYDTRKFKTWINADILSGPVNNTSTIPVDPIKFFDAVKRMDNVTLSIGWTTRWSNDAKEGQYTEAHIQHMLNTIKDNGIDKMGYDITFPIRAGIAAYSVKELNNLYCSLTHTNSVTFTIWSSADDAVNVVKLREFIFAIGLDRIYIDVPDQLRQQLNLTNGRSMNICVK